MTKSLIDGAVSGRIFSRVDAETLMEELLTGRIETPDIVRLLRAMNTRPVRVDELAGFASVMRRHAARVFAADASAVKPAPALNRPPPAWTVQPSPDTSPTLDNALPGVSCTGPASCMAVGYANTGAGLVYRTLIESWNGSTWSIVSSPNVPTGSNYLQSVSCVYPTSCFAVGYHLDGAIEQPLIESWNGSTWSIVPSPSTSATQNNVLTAVSCSNPACASAVGSRPATASSRR